MYGSLASISDYKDILSKVNESEFNILETNNKSNQDSSVGSSLIPIDLLDLRSKAFPPIAPNFVVELRLPD
ncbi:1786_t:CDS:2, partial [Racocetra fulgida]